MTNYLLACLFLILSHVVPSAPGIRARLMDRLGRPLFMVVYSSISLVAAVWFVVGYLGLAGEGVQVFMPSILVVQIGVALMPLAFFLIVGRLTTSFGEAGQPNAPLGIYRICRFPGSTGILIWAGIHFLSTGDSKRIIAFGTFMVIALLAMAKNQLVLKRSPAVESDAFLAQTRIIPFWGIWASPEKIAWAEIGWKRIALPLAFYGFLLLAHPLVIGVDPLGWYG